MLGARDNKLKIPIGLFFRGQMPPAEAGDKRAISRDAGTVTASTFPDHDRAARGGSSMSMRDSVAPAAVVFHRQVSANQDCTCSGESTTEWK